MSHTGKIQIQLLFNRFAEFSENVDAISLLTQPQRKYSYAPYVLRRQCQSGAAGRLCLQGKFEAQWWEHENSLKAHTI